MRRCYRLSKIGAKLPLHHSYGRAAMAEDCRPGFEAFKGPIYSIADTIGPGFDTLGEGDFTPSAGYDLLLLIDGNVFQGHNWNPFTWVVVLPQDVTQLRSIAVADVHAWLREQSMCVGSDGRLSRKAVVTWVGDNLGLVERWMEEHSEMQPIEFVRTIGLSE